MKNFILKKSNLHPSFLQILYLVIFLILFSVIVFTPLLIKGAINLTESLIVEEEMVEGFLLVILFLLSIVILNLYQREIARQAEHIQKISNDKKTVEARLLDSFKYIGKVNVQIQEIKEIFNNNHKYPETKDDFKKTLRFFGERVLGIVNADWVLFRIVDINTKKMVDEHVETRPGVANNRPHISNQMIIEEQPVAGLALVTSNTQNLNLRTGCILPIDKISPDQQVFVQAIINEITMLFVIFNSAYYA